VPDGTLTGASPAPLPPQARAGLFGKLPARGDVIREDLPRDFVDAWDCWWQRGLADTQRMAREDWRAAWLEAPVWRFVLPPGLWQPRCAGAVDPERGQGRAVLPTDHRRHSGCGLGAVGRRHGCVSGGGGAGRARCAGVRSCPGGITGADGGCLYARRSGERYTQLRTRPDKLVDRRRHPRRRMPSHWRCLAGGAGIRRLAR